MKPSLFCLIDLQEKLVPAMSERAEALIQRSGKALQAARLLQIPVLLTEQYPKGLGSTVPAIASCAPGLPVLEKTSFSAFGAAGFDAMVVGHRARRLILAGIEAHVCVRQTCLDALARGLEVRLLADCTESRSVRDRDLALRELEQKGVEIIGFEAWAFGEMRDAKHPAFKAISALVR
ncbi:MAG: hypothetical protein RL095_1232 [Verrucomicrobiota bacterium]